MLGVVYKYLISLMASYTQMGMFNEFRGLEGDWGYFMNLSGK